MKLEDLKKQDLDTALTQALEVVGPRVYTLIRNKSENLKFFVIGCQGTGSPSQKQVAELMDTIALDSSDDQPPAFILFLGDNMYDYGVNSPYDELFNTCFYNMYSSKKGISHLPCFVILGNHDANFHKKANFYPWMASGKSVELNQVRHTYLPDDHRYPSVAAKTKLYKQNELILDLLPQWNMPYRFYSIIADDTQIFCLDSNTYAKDFLNAKKGSIKTHKINQAQWLEQAYAEAKIAKRKIIFSLHHPLYTPGKRAFPADYDTNNYISLATQLPDLQNILKELLVGSYTHTSSYNELLAQIFAAQKFKPTMYFAAHDHALSYWNNDKQNEDELFCQLTCGGGGGDLQKRKKFSEQSQMGCYLKNNGFAVITCDKKNPQKYEIEIHSTEKHYLKFNNKSHYPIRKESGNTALENLRIIALNACDDYFSLKAKAAPMAAVKNKRPANTQNEQKSLLNYLGGALTSILPDRNMLNSILSDHGRDDVDCVHDIMAYFNQPELTNPAIIIDHFIALMCQLHDKTSDTSFATLFYDAFLKACPFEDSEKIHASFSSALQISISSLSEEAVLIKSHRP